MENFRSIVVSLAADYARDLAELEAIRVDLVANQERVARLMVAMKPRQEKIAALAIATTNLNSKNQPQPAPATSVVEAGMDAAPVSLAPLLVAPADLALPSCTRAATIGSTKNHVEPEYIVAEQASIADAGATATACKGDASSSAAALISQEKDVVPGPQLQTETDKASAADVSDSCDAVVEATPAVLIEGLATEPANADSLPVSSEGPTDLRRRVRMPEALTDEPVPSAHAHVDLQLVVLTESAPDRADLLLPATVKEAGAAADTTQCQAVESSDSTLNENLTASSDGSTVTMSGSDTADVDRSLPQNVPVAAKSAAENPSAEEAVARAEVPPSLTFQLDAAALGAPVAPSIFVAEDASTPAPAAVDNFASLDTARLRASKPVSTKFRRRTGMVALLATAAAFSAVVVTAQIYELLPQVEIDRMTEIFSVATGL